MRFDILTLFPDMFTSPLATSILKRAQDQGLISVHIHDIRAVATDTHKTVDDTPYGGGAGMLLKVDIVHSALLNLQTSPELLAIPLDKRRTVLLCAQGKRFKQSHAFFAAETYDQITLICGHYEGIDDRIRKYIDVELSIGDFVLTGGELPAMMVIDAITRLLPSVIRQESPEEESFSLMHEGKELLEYPHYTRPVEYDGVQVPDVLLSGNHAAIATWRHEQSLKRTLERPDNDDKTL